MPNIEFFLKEKEAIRKFAKLSGYKETQTDKSKFSSTFSFFGGKADIRPLLEKLGFTSVKPIIQSFKYEYLKGDDEKSLLVSVDTNGNFYMECKRKPNGAFDRLRRYLVKSREK